MGGFFPPKCSFEIKFLQQSGFVCELAVALPVNTCPLCCPNTLGSEADFLETPKANLNRPPAAISQGTGKKKHRSDASEPEFRANSSHVRGGTTQTFLADIQVQQKPGLFPVPFPQHALSFGPIYGRQRIL